MRRVCCLHFSMMLQVFCILPVRVEHCRVKYQTDKCGNMGQLWNCSDLNLHKIPPEFNTMIKGKVILLDLSSNNFQSISSTTFAGIQTNILRNVTALYMRNNRIKSIDKFSFQRFPRLCFLDLSSCKLKANTPKEFAFSNLTALKILYISENKFDSSKSCRYPESELSRLPSLQELHIDVFKGFRFGKKFESLKQLSKIKFHSRQSVFHLQNYTFSGLSKSPIENLTMDFKHYVQCDVSEEILCSFPYLKRAKMAFGGLCDLIAVLKTLKCLENRTFEELTAVGNVPAIVRQFLILNEENCKYLLKICVKKVDFSSNHIHGISVNLLETTFGKCIEYLDISRNDIAFMETSFVIDFIKNYPKLYYIDASYNDKFFKDTMNYPFNSISKPSINITISKVFKVIRYSHNYVHKIPPVRLNIVGETLKEINISKTKFPCDKIVGMNFPHLEILDISNNNCSDISFHMLRFLTKLKTFRASNANFDFLNESKWISLFDRLTKLELLDIKNNRIPHLPPTLFKKQKMMMYLYLNGNHLSSIPASVAHCRNLKDLYIQNNKIKALQSHDFQVLQSLKNARIFVKGNNLDCDCSHISMLRWMRNNQNLFGDLNETVCMERNLNFSELLQESQFSIFEKKCQSGMWLMSSSFMLFFVICGMVIGIVIKRYRVHVDYVILRLRSRWRGVAPSNEMKHFQFDAFVSYSENDYQLVCITMYHALEKLGLQISFPDKDFIPGFGKAEQLVQCIDLSRKVVFVITEEFLVSGWNSYAVQMAVTHAFHNHRKRSIIVIIKDNIPIERMPKDLRYIWWCIFSIQWPETENAQTMDSFWKEIAVALR